MFYKLYLNALILFQEIVDQIFNWTATLYELNCITFKNACVSVVLPLIGSTLRPDTDLRPVSVKPTQPKPAIFEKKNSKSDQWPNYGKSCYATGLYNHDFFICSIL